MPSCGIPCTWVPDTARGDEDFFFQHRPGMPSHLLFTCNPWFFGPFCRGADCHGVQATSHRWSGSSIMARSAHIKERKIVSCIHRSQRGFSSPQQFLFKNRGLRSIHLLSKRKQLSLFWREYPHYSEPHAGGISGSGQGRTRTDKKLGETAEYHV